MAILSMTFGTTANQGVTPRRVEILTSDSLATITTAGYLSNAKVAPNAIYPTDIFDIRYAITVSNPAGTYTQLIPSISAGVITLVVSAAGDALTNAHIFVGNASNVATDVAMSGDTTIANTGVVTIANNAITTAKILAANVTLAKLAAGITPSHVIKFAGQVTTVGGAAAEAFVVTGAVAATDRAFVQVVNDGTGNVTVLQAVVTTDTLTVTFSANPGNDCVFNYQLVRVAS